MGAPQPQHLRILGVQSPPPFFFRRYRTPFSPFKLAKGGRTGEGKPRRSRSSARRHQPRKPSATPVVVFSLRPSIPRTPPISGGRIPLLSFGRLVPCRAWACSPWHSGSVLF